MSGTGGLTIAAGTQTLSGQNTYIGTTDVAQKVSLTLSGRIAGALNNIGTTDVKGGAVGGATDNTGTLTAENGTFQAITNSGTAKPSNSQTGARQSSPIFCRLMVISPVRSLVKGLDRRQRHHCR